MPIYFLIGLFLFLGGIFLNYYLRYSFNKANESLTNITGSDLLSKLSAGSNLIIKEVDGVLTDHYMPSENSISLSSDVYHGRGVGSIAVALHEYGHSLQYKEGNIFTYLHGLLFKPMQIGSYGSILFFIIGQLLNNSFLIMLGIILFSIVLIYSLLLTYIEYDASQRAREIVKILNLNEDQSRLLNKTLNIAFLTYFLSLLQIVIQLLELIKVYNEDE